MKNTRRPQSRPRVARSAALLIAIAASSLGGAMPAHAGSYYGWGDTGWAFYDKRECCEEAVWLAQEESISLCENAGGHAKVRSGSTRGMCDWDARGDSRDRVYRCTAKANVLCR